MGGHGPLGASSGGQGPAGAPDGGNGPLHELGFYTLAGAKENPRELLVEAQAAERLGLGAAFISERFNIKEAATISGALGAVTTRLGIATAATNHNTRHPIITASHAMTMHKLTGGRYSLGIGRDGPVQAGELGLDAVTIPKIADFAWLMRRLWSGETITDHDGPAGRFPRLSLDLADRIHIPMTINGFGPKTLALGGRIFDAVVLPPFFADETTSSAVEVVRLAAEKSGRDPASVRIWSVVAASSVGLPAQARRRKMVGRLATHLQTDGDLLVDTNGWDTAVLERFRHDLFVRSFQGPIESGASDSELDHVADLLPPQWLAPAAFGGVGETVAKIRHQFALGVDGVVLSGPTPWEMEPVISVYRAARNPGPFARLKANPAALVRPLRGESSGSPPAADQLST